MRIVCFVPKTSGDAAPRLGALLPDDVHVPRLRGRDQGRLTPPRR